MVDIKKTKKNLKHITNSITKDVIQKIVYKRKK